MFFACGLVLLIFILPALAISWVIPADQLSLTAGVMQAFDAFFAYFNLQKLVPIVAIALVCASAGGMLTWLAGPSKGLLLIARKEGYLPPFFQHQNENEFPVNILVVQGAITTVIALLYALVPSVSSAYWILSVMTTQVYLIVYLLMFVAAVKLRTHAAQRRARLHGAGAVVMCVVGFLASAAAILIGFVPPSQFENGSDAAYIGLILAGTVLLGLLPPWLFLKFRKPGWKSAERGGRRHEPLPMPPGGRRTATTSGSGTGSSAPSSSSWRSSASITYSGKKDDEAAQQKAAQLTQAFQRAGLTRARRPGHLRPLARQRRRGGLRQPRQRARPGDAARPDDQRRRLRRPPAGHRRFAHPGRRGADPADVLPRGAARSSRRRSTSSRPTT